MLKFSIAIIIFLSFSLYVFGQVSDSLLTKRYDLAYQIILKALKSNGDFKNCVFAVEKAYDNNLSDVFFNNGISFNLNLIDNFFSLQTTQNKKFKDSTHVRLNYSIFHVLKDTTKIVSKNKIINIAPFEYDFTDPQGNQDWTNTFVTKLLGTHKGNCRSLTYLYKILADELGAKCWLALAPNHIYIRNYSKQIGWYNTELTSGTFPTDAWIAATGYVNTDAIRSGVYMDTLSNQQSIGLCIMDLAQGYIKQTNNYTDSFVLKCCNLVLQYHSVNPEALLTKAEALKRMYLKQKEENNSSAQTTYDEMEQTYITLVKLGYREMPYKAYQKWLKTAKQDKEKYQNQRLKATLNKH